MHQNGVEFPHKLCVVVCNIWSVGEWQEERIKDAHIAEIAHSAILPVQLCASLYQIFGDLTNIGSIVTGVLGLLFCSLLLAGLCKGDDASLAASPAQCSPQSCRSCWCRCWSTSPSTSRWSSASSSGPSWPPPRSQTSGNMTPGNMSTN